MGRALLLVATLVQSSAALNVAVAGATGRVGSLVVQELLASGHAVTALIRNETKASHVLPSAVACRALDLATATGSAMKEACAGTDRLIWCASGFTAEGDSLSLIHI